MTNDRNKKSRLVNRVKRIAELFLQFARRVKTALIVFYKARPVITICCTSIFYFVTIGMLLFFVAHSGAKRELQQQAKRQYINPAQNFIRSEKNSADKKLINALNKKINLLQQDILSSRNRSDDYNTQLITLMTALQKSISALKVNSDTTKTTVERTSLTAQQNLKNSYRQIAAVISELKVIHKKLDKQTYLAVNVLPFTVVGFDFWNGQPMVTIAVKDVAGVAHYRLMGQGQSFACLNHTRGIPGCSVWRVAKLSTDPNVVVFANSKGQKVKVEL